VENLEKLPLAFINSRARLLSLLVIGNEMRLEI
jgi:hypothetical protein